MILNNWKFLNSRGNKHLKSKSTAKDLNDVFRSTPAISNGFSNTPNGVANSKSKPSNEKPQRTVSCDTPEMNSKKCHEHKNSYVVIPLACQRTVSEHIEGIQRSFSVKSFDEIEGQTSSIAKRIPKDAEATSVLIGSLDFLHQPIMAFVRLSKGRYLENLTEVNLPVRFLFLVMGPPQAGLDYYEIGRSISTLMTNAVSTSLEMTSS